MEQESIIFLLKAMKGEYVEQTIKQGRFCFNHSTLFSKWEDPQSAQFDKWEGHSSMEATDLMAFPILEYREDGFPIYGNAIRLADKAIIHSQTGEAKDSPICCFRAVERDEITIQGGSVNCSLGETANRIIGEFGYDSYVLIKAKPFIKQVKERKEFYMSGRVVYQDTMNQFPQKLPDEYERIAEQLLRKDKKYEWQKEYRIILRPTKAPRVFLEIGSIEDIAISGKLSDLIMGKSANCFSMVDELS